MVRTLVSPIIGKNEDHIWLAFCHSSGSHLSLTLRQQVYWSFRDVRTHRRFLINDLGCHKQAHSHWAKKTESRYLIVTPF